MAIEPEPPGGRPLVYMANGARCIGQYLGRAIDPPRHRRGQAPAWTPPAAVVGWVMAADSLALVARIAGTWRAVDIPHGMPRPDAGLAHGHRAAPSSEQLDLLDALAEEAR